MLEPAVRDQQDARVGVLFSPGTVVVIDIFRALGDFEDHYDITALDSTERRLARFMPQEVAKGIVSDALLLAFGVRRERAKPLEFRPPLSRRGSLDEYRLVAILAAAFWHDFVLAAKAAGALGIGHPQPLISLAFDIARRLETAGITLAVPDARLFREEAFCTPVVVETQLRRTDLKLSFEF